MSSLNEQENTTKCPHCGKPMTEREMIQAGLIPNPDETVDQFFARTGQND
jgi:hypothetical protein